MRSPFTGLLALTLLLVLCPGLKAKTNPETLARNVLSENEHEAASAIAELRAQGPEGLNALFQLYRDEIQKQIAGSAPTDNWERLHDALDEVSQQRDSYISGLYWYTDLSEAKAAARASGKPILSLRLLGKLTEEFSCANSRFFRSVLYSNQGVSKLLREHFVLHWQSVRPAPRITIDFGDGRKLQGTITGNSIHYVLDSEGLTLDALPGLYGPQAFIRELTRSQQLYDEVKGIPYLARTRALNEYHQRSISLTTTRWLVDVKKAGGQIPEGFVLKINPDGTPRAIDIAPLAVTKALPEGGILRAMTRGAEALGKVTDEEIWTRIALQHISDARLDDRSIELIRKQTLKLLKAISISDRLAEARMKNLVQKLEMSIAMDTVRNEYLLRTKLHAWLIADPSRSNLESFNDKVYAELFLTPKSDPWLGLFSPETYMALERGGVQP
jgi:hypothetical protein